MTAGDDQSSEREQMLPLEGIEPGGPSSTTALERPFGYENRTRLLAEYLDTVGYVAPAQAWLHVYRLLLWVDNRTGLAHCYESDKCQPGRPWYARSLAFHAWVSDALEVAPRELGEGIDWLFRRVVADLADAALAEIAANTSKAESQRRSYAAGSMPVPGDDPEVVSILRDVLSPYLSSQPAPEVMRELTERLQTHMRQGNKRQNLLGEGFEDALAMLLERIPGIQDKYSVYLRRELHKLHGFHPPRGTEKPRKVDLALVRNRDNYRVLVSCKWSIRSDREEQLISDFRSYSELEASGQDFDYVLVTNEFDPARLAAACELRRENALLLHHVVHLNPAGPVAAYAAPGVTRRARPGQESGESRALGHIDTGRLSGLTDWIEQLQDQR